MFETESNVSLRDLAIGFQENWYREPVHIKLDGYATFIYRVLVNELQRRGLEVPNA